MIEVTFLGTGSAFAAGRRGYPALLIEAGNFRMLVEAGPTIVQQLAHAGLRATDVERLFVTHSHGDHTLGFPVLALNRLGDAMPLRIYAGDTTIAMLKTLLAIAYPRFTSNSFMLDWHVLSETGMTKTILAPDITLHTVNVPYPPGVPTLAARWNFAAGTSVAFVTDTCPNSATLELVRGCDLLIHEATFSAILQPGADPAEQFHSTAQQAGELARAAGCARLALVHLGTDVGEHPEVLVEEARAGSTLQVIVPEDGERIRLP